MPTTSSAKKRLRQNERRRQRNQAEKSRIKTLKKKVLAAIDSGDSATAQKALRECFSALDRAAKKNVFHKKKAARDKSRLAAAARRKSAP
jgi:small subunit ribosomal protein S20